MKPTADPAAALPPAWVLNRAEQAEYATLTAYAAHSAEHDAYDLGLADGEEGFDTSECPNEFLDEPHLRKAYLHGHTLGQANRAQRRPRVYACCDCHAPFNLRLRPAAECAQGELCATCWEARGDSAEDECDPLDEEAQPAGDEDAWPERD